MRRTFLRFPLHGAAWVDSALRAKGPRPERVAEQSRKPLPFAEPQMETAPSEVVVHKKAAKKSKRKTKYLAMSAATEKAMLLPREDVLSHEAALIRKTYEGVDVRSPATLPTGHHIPGEIPKGNISWRDKVLAVSDFISGHFAHHAMLEEWAVLFDLKALDIEVRYFLWILHLQMLSRRAVAIPVEKWARRREVLQEIQISMRSSWEESCAQVLGRPPLQRQKDYLMDMYYVVSTNFEEALSGTEMNAQLTDPKAIVPSTGEASGDMSGSDLALLSFIFRFIPFQRPEDIPLYSYYRLVHYIRFHLALLDRIPDEEIVKGNFNFINPMSKAVCESYEEVPLS